MARDSPAGSSQAHQTAGLAALVCSNMCLLLPAIGPRHCAHFCTTLPFPGFPHALPAVSYTLLFFILPCLPPLLCMCGFMHALPFFVLLFVPFCCLSPCYTLCLHLSCMFSWVYTHLIATTTLIHLSFLHACNMPYIGNNITWEQELKQDNKTTLHVPCRAT